MFFLTKCSKRGGSLSSLSGQCFITRRNMTSSEIAKILRPFYFVVHPDLFGRYPNQRAVNEESLKLLSAHLETISNKKMLPATPTPLPFYVRSSTMTEVSSKLVKVPLERSIDPKRILRKILQTCELPTDDVDQMKSEPPPSYSHPKNHRASQYQESSPPGVFDEDLIYKDIKKKQEERTLDGWLRGNLEVARERRDNLMGLRDEIEKLKEEVAKKLKLKDLRYDCGWNIEHFRGCMKSLEYMADLHKNEMRFLEDRILVFAPFTGISLDGHVMLFTGDVKHNWLDFIRKIPKHDQYLKKIPAYEYALSQVLRNIKIARRKFMPKTQAEHYASYLRKITTALLDYLGRSKFPKSWPESLDQFEIVVESEAGPLMVSPTGQLIVPSTCPGSLLVDFITNNLAVAKEKAETYNRTKHVERDLHKKVLEKLELNSLTKDDSVFPDKMVVCLEQLLKLGKGQLPSISKMDLHITHYYSVLSDGIVCVPWNWKME